MTPPYAAAATVRIRQFTNADRPRCCFMEAFAHVSQACFAGRRCRCVFATFAGRNRFCLCGCSRGGGNPCARTALRVGLAGDGGGLCADADDHGSELPASHFLGRRDAGLAAAAGSIVAPHGACVEPWCGWRRIFVLCFGAWMVCCLWGFTAGVSVVFFDLLWAGVCCVVGGVAACVPDVDCCVRGVQYDVLQSAADHAFSGGAILRSAGDEYGAGDVACFATG